MSNLVLLNAAL